jgi:Na+-transporting methylmalonyl-CoA/oxaloacetate decarboxylase gamma subunit
MFLTTMGVSEAGITALLGYAVVFFGLILLMIVTILLGKFFTALAKKEQKIIITNPAPVEVREEPTAPGSAGGVKLHNVEPKTAAMLMAIVADQLGKPLNELRFISIKEVEK